MGQMMIATNLLNQIFVKPLKSDVDTDSEDPGSLKPIQSDPFESKVKMMALLMQSLHNFGCPILDLDEFFEQVSKALGLTGYFSCQHNLIFMFLEDGNGKSCQQPVQLSMNFALAKLELLEQKIMKLRYGYYNSVDDFMEELVAVRKMPSLYPKALTVFSHGVLAASAVGGIFRGGWEDIVLSFLLGCHTGLACLYLPWLFPHFGFSLEVVCPFLHAFIIKLCCVTFSDHVISFWPVALGSCIFPLPGFTFIYALQDLISKFSVSGVLSALRSTFICAVMATGYYAGISAMFWRDLSFGELQKRHPTGVHDGFLFLLIPAFAVFINVIYESSPKQMISAFVIVCISYIMQFYLAAHMHPYLLAFIVALFIALGSNAWYRLFGQSRFPAIFSAVLPLAPGSIGARAAAFVYLQNLSESFAMFGCFILSGMVVAFAFVLCFKLK